MGLILDNRFYRDLNHSRPKGYTDDKQTLHRIEVDCILQKWRDKQPFARSFKTPWNYLRYRLQNVLKISGCTFCQRWKYAKLIKLSDCEKIYKAGQDKQSKISELKRRGYYDYS